MENTPPPPARLEDRRRRFLAALQLEDAVILIGAGEPVPLPEGSDQTYLYRSHAEYYYLMGQECCGALLAVDLKTGVAGEWVNFVPDITERERVYDGREQPPGTSISALEGWLGQRRGRPIIMLGCPLRGVRPDEEQTTRARQILLHFRRPKDGDELALVRQAAVATAAGYDRLRSLLRVGVTERRLMIELEAGFLRAGASRPGYPSIIGIGNNAAVLHYTPTNRAALAGDYVLIDAAAEVDRYMVDVSRTYHVGPVTPFQRELHQVVLTAEENGIARCVPGAEWKEIHLAACRDLVTGLVALGLMRGSPDSLVEQNAHLLFFPCGLGHLVGLGVRDASGSLAGRPKDPRPCLNNLRMDLPLAAGYLLTVEPGIYFIPALLNDPARRARYRDCINWSLVEQHMHLGGVRVEDTVLVTAGAPESLTHMIPKTL